MSRLTRTLAALSLVACLAAAASAQTTPADGTLLEKKTFDAWDYDKLAPWQRQIYPRETFDALRTSPDVELLKIRYASDGLGVAGFIAKPKKTTGRLPVIIFNRGGLGDGIIGMSNFNYIHEMFRYASEGFVVLASSTAAWTARAGATRWAAPT